MSLIKRNSREVLVYICTFVHFDVYSRLIQSCKGGSAIQGKTEVGSAMCGNVLSRGISLSRAFTYRDSPEKPFPCWVFHLQRHSPEIIPGDAFTRRRQLSSWHVFLTRLKGMFYSHPLPCRINTSKQSSY